MPIIDLTKKILLSQLGLDLCLKLIFKMVPQEQKQTFFGLLLDLEMARISGWQVAQNLRASGLFHEMPIVAMTSTVDDGVRQRCTALDITHVFAKPYNPQALLGALAEATGATVASRSAQAA